MLHIPGFLKLCSSRNLTNGRNNGERNDNWKASPRDNVLLKTANSTPIQDGWPADPITTEIITSQCGLTMPCSNSIAEGFAIFNEIKHVFTLHGLQQGLLIPYWRPFPIALFTIGRGWRASTWLGPRHSNSWTKWFSRPVVSSLGDSLHYQLVLVFCY